MTRTKPLRFGVWDWLIVAAVLAVIALIAWRVQTVLVYKWNWSVVPAYLVRFDEETGRYAANLLLQGFFVTIRLSIWAGFAAAIIGLLVALMRVANQLFFQAFGRIYVELIRNIPPLVFIFIFYFFISSQIMPLLGIDGWARTLDPLENRWFVFLFGDPKLFEAFVSGVICLAMFEAAYVAEIIRGGIQTIPKGQWEAASSIGLSSFDRMRYVILPQAISRTIPPLANQFISLIKDSSIVSLIAIQELTFMASQTVTTTQRVFEIWITVGVLYFILCFVLSLLFQRFERR